MKRILLLSVLAAAIMACQSENRNPSGVSFDEVMTSRRSVRDFDGSKTISQTEIRTLIEATQDAPSWTNSQPTRYYVALSPEKMESVRDLLPEFNQNNTDGASAYIVSTFVKGQSGFYRGIPSNEVGDGWGAYDNGLANAYLILKARAMGFDTLILGGRDAEGLRTLFEIPEEERVMAVIALGYRASTPTRPGRKPVDEILKIF